LTNASSAAASCAAAPFRTGSSESRPVPCLMLHTQVEYCVWKPTYEARTQAAEQVWRRGSRHLKTQPLKASEVSKRRRHRLACSCAQGSQVRACERVRSRTRARGQVLQMVESLNRENGKERRREGCKCRNNNNGCYMPQQRRLHSVAAEAPTTFPSACIAGARPASRRLCV